MCFIWIIAAAAAVCAYIAGVIKGRRERNQRREFERCKYNPYTTRGFNTLYVFESEGSFCVNDDPEYYLHSSSEEDFEVPPTEEYLKTEEVWPEEETISESETEKNPAVEEEDFKSRWHREELQTEEYTDLSVMGEEIMSDEVYTLGTEVRRYYDPPEHVRPENIGISSVKVYVVSLRFDWGWRSNYYPRVVLLVEMYGNKLYTWLTTEDGEEYLSRENSEKNSKFLHQDDKEQIADRLAVKYFYNEWYRAYHPETNVLGDIYNKKTKESEPLNISKDD